MTKNIERYNQEVDYTGRILPQFFDEIIWQHEGAGLDGFCSLKTCRNKLRHNEELIKIRDSVTDLVAIFHISCYQSIIKSPPSNLPLQGTLKNKDSKDIIWIKTKPTDEVDWYCSLRSCQKLILYDEKSIILEEENSEKVAIFHVNCFDSLLKKLKK